MATEVDQPRGQPGSLHRLLHPRGQARLLAGMLGSGVLLGWLAVSRLNTPLWGAVVLVLSLLLYPATRKWQRDRHHVGTPGVVLSILLVTQGFHTIEHLAQWVQYHILSWSLNAANGLIAPLNAEVVRFTWNWAVLLVVVYVLHAGLRNR